MKRKRITAAAALLVAVLGINFCGKKPENAEVYFKKGAEFFQQKMFDKAVEMYAKGLKIKPDSAVGYNLLGMAYRFRFNQTGDQGYKSQEIEAFKKAIKFDPTLVFAYKNLAATFYYMGRKREAAPLLLTALKLNPEDPEKDLMVHWIREGQDSHQGE